MGMHEIESAVEASVCLLNQHITDTEKARSLFWNLYEFQSFFDTGYTHFRVIDILLKRHFVYKIKKEEYPGYQKYKPYIENLEDKWILEHPDKEWDKEKNSAVAFLNPSDELIYFDAGSHPWKHLVSSGFLTGIDANPPKKIPIEEIVKNIFIYAKEDNNKEIMRTWFAILPVYLFWSKGNVKFATLKENSAIKTIKEISEQMNLIIMNGSDWDYGFLRIPLKKEIQEGEIEGDAKKFLLWWFFD